MRSVPDDFISPGGLPCSWQDRSGEGLETTLHRHVWLYNQQLPQSALGSNTLLQVMKKCYEHKAEHSCTVFRDGRPLLFD